MRFIDFKNSLRQFPVFSLTDIKKIDFPFRRSNLNAWQKKGYIRKIVSKHYIFADIDPDESLLFYIANKIYDPSYVSLQTALAYHGLIPESVYGITSIATRRTYEFNTFCADFIYKNVKPNLFFGYILENFNNRRVKIASPEKALLDYFYLNSRFVNEGQFMELRIDSEVFNEKVDLRLLRKYLFLFANKSLTGRMEKFLTYMKHA